MILKIKELEEKGLRAHFVVGPVSAGKGTTVEVIHLLLKELYPVTIIGMSKVIGKYSNEDSALGETLRDQIKKVKACPRLHIADAPVIAALQKEMRLEFEKGNHNQWIEGFIRTYEQARSVIDLRYLKVYYLEAEKSFCLERASKRVAEALLKGEPPRDDDKPEYVKERYTTFEEETLPGIRFVRDTRGTALKVIDASLPLRKKCVRILKHTPVGKKALQSLMARFDRPNDVVAQKVAEVESLKKPAPKIVTEIATPMIRIIPNHLLMSIPKCKVYPLRRAESYYPAPRIQ